MQGYKALTLNRAGQIKTFLVHRLVSLAFLGPALIGYEVNHLDGNKKNNRLANLEYVRRTENMAHAVSIGILENRGENNPQAKLRPADIERIRADYLAGGKWRGGVGYKVLAKRHGVSWEAIRNIIKGKAWQTT